MRFRRNPNAHPPKERSSRYEVASTVKVDDDDDDDDYFILFRCILYSLQKTKAIDKLGLKIPKDKNSLQ